MFDVAVIGGGAAGFFTAINLKLKRPDFKVIIFEKSNKTLSKVLVSGGGRCNVTHHCFDVSELVKFYPRGGDELLSVFKKFGPQDTINWFNKQGVKLKVEKDGRIFPVSDDSTQIIQCFEKLIHQLNVKLNLNEGLKNFEKTDNGFEIETNQGNFFTKNLVITGGSSPSLWALLKMKNISIIDPVPSLFTFNIKHPVLSEMMGTSFQNSSVKLILGDSDLKNYKLKKADVMQSGPMLITHWGLSGPAVLKLSSVAALLLNSKSYRFNVEVNFIHQSIESTMEELLKFKSENSKKQCSSHALFGLSSRFWNNVCQFAIENPSKNWADLNKKELNKLSETLCQLNLEVNGKSTFKEEFVTAGGVDLKEIDFRSMEFRNMKGLYFAGEILNIDALTGGFNFQACWSEAWIISEHLK